jgi:uncharacterized metal-binding protein
MPSARGHDIITVAAAPPTFIATYLLTHSTDLSLIATAATLFAGFMFGPDLDIHSKQYTRWGPFAFLWWPYKVVFSHRSRLSHGIIFGTAIRVLYFVVAVGLIVGGCLSVYKLLHPQAGEHLTMPGLIRQVWHTLSSLDGCILRIMVGRDDTHAG